MAKGTYGTTIGTIYDPAVGAPLDSRMMVPTYADLIDVKTWKVDGGTSTESYAYYGMMVYVGNDPDTSKNGLYVLKASGSGTTTTDAQSHANWERISQTDTTIAALSSAIENLESASSGDFTNLIAKIDTVSSNVETVSSDLADISTKLETVSGDLDAAEQAIDTKLNKNFKSYDAGDINSTVVFPANTEAGANVYITGEQIKDFAASAVSDKGNFVDEAAIKAAFPTPDEGWYATNLETGTTWIVVDGQWTDSGSTNGVVSVNGKSGKVTLVAADIDDVYSKTETDAAITSAQTDLTSAIDSVEAKVDANTTNIEALSSAIDGNSSLIDVLSADISDVASRVDVNVTNIATNLQSINSINSQITGINSTLAGKQDAAIDVTIGEEQKTSIPDALTALNTIATGAAAGLESKADVDASNIESSVWKTKLGYQDANDVSNAVTSAIEPVSTKLDTVSSDLDTAEVTIASQGQLIEGLRTDVDAVSGKADANAAAVATKAEADASNITASTWRDKLEVNSKTEVATTYQKQTLTDKVFDDVTTVEGTLARLNTNIVANDGDITNLQTTVGDSTKGLVKSVTENTSAIAANTANIAAISGVVDTKANTADVVLNSEVDTTLPTTATDGHVPSTGLLKTELDKKQNILTQYTENSELVSLQAGSQILLQSGGYITYNGGVDPQSTGVEQTLEGSAVKLPTAKAVKDAIDTIKSEVSTAYQFKGSDTYANIIAKTGMEVGDVWNSTTANETYPAGTNYAWTGEEWDALGGEVDLSAYQTKAVSVAGISATTVESALAEIAAEVNTKQDTLSHITDNNQGVTITTNTDESITLSSQTSITLSAEDIKLNGAFISGSAIEQTLEGNSFRLPTAKAVKDVTDTKADANASNLTTENVASWKAKLGFITSDEVPEQVQSDWNVTDNTSKAYIANKPNIYAGSSLQYITTSDTINLTGILYGYPRNSSDCHTEFSWAVNGYQDGVTGINLNQFSGSAVKVEIHSRDYCSTFTIMNIGLSNDEYILSEHNGNKEFNVVWDSDSMLLSFDAINSVTFRVIAYCTIMY